MHFFASFLLPPRNTVQEVDGSSIDGVPGVDFKPLVAFLAAAGVQGDGAEVAGKDTMQ